MVLVVSEYSKVSEHYVGDDEIIDGGFSYMVVWLAADPSNHDNQGSLQIPHPLISACRSACESSCKEPVTDAWLYEKLACADQLQ
jgi:hypothetical protein